MWIVFSITKWLHLISIHLHRRSACHKSLGAGSRVANSFALVGQGSVFFSHSYIPLRTPISVFSVEHFLWMQPNLSQAKNSRGNPRTNQKNWEGDCRHVGKRDRKMDTCFFFFLKLNQRQIVRLLQSGCLVAEWTKRRKGAPRRAGPI